MSKFYSIMQQLSAKVSKQLVWLVKTNVALAYDYIDVHVKIQIDFNKSVVQLTKLRIISRALRKLTFSNRVVKISLKFFKAKIERKLICMLNDKYFKKFVNIDHYVNFDELIKEKYN